MRSTEQDDALALEVGRLAGELNQAFEAAWRAGLRCEVKSTNRRDGQEGLARVQVEVMRPLDTYAPPVEEDGQPRTIGSMIRQGFSGARNGKGH